MKTMDWLYNLCRWTLGGLFIYAGGRKVLEPNIFAILIDAYGVVPEELLMLVAIGLPLLEMIAGVFYVYIWRRYGATRPVGVMVVGKQLFTRGEKRRCI